MQRKSLFHLTLPDLSLSCRADRAGTEVKTTEEWWLLAHSLLISNTAQAHPPRDGATHSGLDPATSIISQDSSSQKWPHANLMEAILQLKVYRVDNKTQPGHFVICGRVRLKMISHFVVII